MENFFIFIFGLSIGSFLNCLIYRLEKNESFWRGRSYCPHCNHILSWLDLIPLFSFLILKGKCRYCNQKISLQYPLVELSTAILFILIFNQFLISNFLNLIYYWFITSLLIIIFVYDLKHYLIPDKIIYLAIILTLFYQFQFFSWDLIFGVLPSLFFLAIIIFSKEKWLGMGDFKLAILMGLFLGWPKILIALFLAFFIGAIIGMGLIIANKKTLKSEIPFGPFLVAGTFLTLFLEEKIINYYLNLF